MDILKFEKIDAYLAGEEWAEYSPGQTAIKIVINDVDLMDTILSLEDNSDFRDEPYGHIPVEWIYDELKNVLEENVSANRSKAYAFCCGSCGEPGCWSVQFQVSILDGQVHWKNFRHNHTHQIYDLHFIFSEEEYKEEIKRLEKYSTYHFFGCENTAISPMDCEYEIYSPKQLYDVLSSLWCRETCAPRLQESWSPENKTLGQCSITAFLSQDIFGGKVYGIKRPGGNYHCYNAIGDYKFDLTSEQFGEEVLDYENSIEQFREIHFAKAEKKQRYEYLKQCLMEYCGVE